MVHAPPLIAVIDDDERVLTALRRLLGSIGYAATGFTSGAEFLAACDRLQPDCLVLDQQMPGMDGAEVRQRLAARGSTVPIVMITGKDSTVARERALAGGVSGWLCKPIDKDALIGAIEQALQGVMTRK